MSALDELRAALAAEREGWDYEPESSVRAVGKNETDAALARVEAELADLRALAYMPTTWLCEKCGYTTKQGPPRQCPVCGGLLTRETWKQRAHDWAHYAESLADCIRAPSPPGSTEPEEVK